MDGVIAKIGPFFNWCIREKYSRENPVKGVIRPKEDESEPCILTPDEVFRILTVAQRHSAKLIPYLVLGLFGGVRPEEINRLQWQDISIHGITISGHKAKTRKRRLVSISATSAEKTRRQTVRAEVLRTPLLSIANVRFAFSKFVKFCHVLLSVYETCPPCR